MSPWYVPTYADAAALRTFRSADDPRSSGARSEPWAKEVDEIITNLSKRLRRPPTGVVIHLHASGDPPSHIDTVLVIEDSRMAGATYTEADFTLGILAVKNMDRGHHLGTSALVEFESICTRRAREHGLRQVAVEALVMRENLIMNALLEKSGWKVGHENDGYGFWIKAWPVMLT